MSLLINWTAPVPLPNCGFNVSYRRNYDPSYSTISTSGGTSGNTLQIYISQPACYEGYVESNCCANNYSEIAPFGINAYQTIHLSYEISDDILYITATTLYPNSYNLLGEVTIYFHIGDVFSSYTGPITYPAGETSYEASLPVSPGFVIDDFTVNYLLPAFDNGGSLQQFDSVNTPPYIQTYWDGNTSGATWNGSPIDLPSFILREFNVTVQDPDNIPLAGNLLISWISPGQYEGNDSPYNEVIFSVFDETNALVGTTVSVPGVGFTQTTITLTKAVSDLSIATEFTMITQWGDGTETATKLFYLPLF